MIEKLRRKIVAREMRAAGKKLREISEALRVSIPLVSGWCRDIEVPNASVPKNLRQRLELARTRKEQRRRERVEAQYQTNQKAMPDLPGEEWRKIRKPERCHQYMISNCGRVRHVRTRRILKQMTNVINGRKWVNLSKVYAVGIKYLMVNNWMEPAPFPGAVVSFRNHDFTDLRLSNLYWATRKDVLVACHADGVIPSVLSRENARRRALIQQARREFGTSINKLAAQFDCTHGCVRNALRTMTDEGAADGAVT